MVSTSPACLLVAERVCSSMEGVEAVAVALAWGVLGAVGGTAVEARLAARGAVLRRSRLLWRGVFWAQWAVLRLRQAGGQGRRTQGARPQA